MLTSLLDYELPDERIAKYPTSERDGARMLVVESEGVQHDRVALWPERVPAGSLVVLNDTRVVPARVLGRREPTGGRVELLLTRRLSAEGEVERWAAIGRASKPLRPGTVVTAHTLRLTLLSAEEGALTVQVEAEGGVSAALEAHGHVPIPPYLAREDDASDRTRYQTVFARNSGSVAAPTASLHLTEVGLQRLVARGVQVRWVTLHVGLGTFRPVMSEDLDQHPMHSEVVEVPADTVEAVIDARRRGRPVIAVGTTVVRALESARQRSGPGPLKPLSGETELLIQPGYRFGVVDGLLTNFHAPRSTLLALVGAFVGLERMRAAYATALETGYRFLSYGDAMWIPPREESRP